MNNPFVKCAIWAMSVKVRWELGFLLGAKNGFFSLEEKTKLEIQTSKMISFSRLKKGVLMTNLLLK